MSNARYLFNSTWEKAMRNSEPAKFATGIRKIPYSELVTAIENEDSNFIMDFVQSFYNGTIYIFTNAFKQKDLVKLKNAAFMKKITKFKYQYLNY